MLARIDLSRSSRLPRNCFGSSVLRPKIQTKLMGSCSESEDQFFDTREDASSISDVSSDNNDDFVVSSEIRRSTLEYDFWTKEPHSVDERRAQFLKWMGFGSNLLRTDEEEEVDSDKEDVRAFVGRRVSKYEESPNDLDCEPQFSSSSSLQSSVSDDSSHTTIKDGHLDQNRFLKIKNLDSGAEFVMDDYADDGTPTSVQEVGSDKKISLDEFLTTLGSSRLVQQLFRKDSKEYTIVVDRSKNLKTNWLQRFFPRTVSLDRAKGRLLSKPNVSADNHSSKVRVQVHKKKTKELSSLCSGQEFSAHEGSISTMKFSPDGRFLASGGVDGVVRVWNVLEDDVNKLKLLESDDPSCLYFSLNHFSKLSTVNVPKEEESSGRLGSKSFKKPSHPTCVILPPKAFQLSEKPRHEFHGHEGEVLALSWSNNGFLLSSSVDKTARLWRLEDNQCLSVYSHNNYVTCVEFNPLDDNQFISGSIDGKLRIWDVRLGRVIDWIDVREILTAVCYSPDGKGGIVGSMEGNCRYYDFTDKQLVLGDQICLKGNKTKLPCKRITGFQYCPSDASKVMVTSADSKVRIISGTNIICKFKGNNSNSTCKYPACFTSDGEHIVLGAEDSNVRVWSNPNPPHRAKPTRPVKTASSSETFSAQNASIAIPWLGLKDKIGSLQRWPAGLGFILDALHKGSATWPEEKLSRANNLFAGKPDFKFLKNAWLSAIHSPHSWGLVIVTAGWDGCIRTFLNHGLPLRF